MSEPTVEQATRSLSEEVRWETSVGGRTYRTGFLKAFWGGALDHATPRTVKTLRRTVTLSLDRDIYHYTSLPGFQGIIQDGGFWASDNRFLNDAEERLDGAKLAATVLGHRAARVRSAELATVLQRVRTGILARPTSGLMIVCFSTARDSLEQWRGYGAGGGICIKLSTTPSSSGRHLFFGPQQLLHSVFYSRRKKIELLLETINAFEREYAIDRISMTDRWPSDHDENYVDHLRSAIEGRTLGFKNVCFAQEQELRLVIHESYADDYQGGIQFRASKLGLIPYLHTGKLKNEDGLLPISEVIVGPDARQTLIAESVETFLRHHGYDVSVTLSDVPFRG